MQKSKQNQATCGGDLKPREATQLEFPGMALPQGKAPVMDYLSLSQSGKTSTQTVSA